MSFNPLEVNLQAQTYAAIRVQVGQDIDDTDVVTLYLEVHNWLTKRKIAVTGPALIRYLSMNTVSGVMEVHIGYPIAPHTAYHDRIEFDELPAGTYLIAVHRGPYETLYKTSGMLLDWATEHGIQWQNHGTGDVVEWVGRVEHYIVGPNTETNPRNWHTEIAILKD